MELLLYRTNLCSWVSSSSIDKSSNVGPPCKSISRPAFEAYVFPRNRQHRSTFRALREGRLTRVAAPARKKGRRPSFVHLYPLPRCSNLVLAACFFLFVRAPVSTHANKSPRLALHFVSFHVGSNPVP